MNKEIRKFMKIFRTFLILCVSMLILFLAGMQNPSAADTASDAAILPEKVAEHIPIETITTDSFSMDYFQFGHGEKTLVILPGLSVQSVMDSADQVASGYQALTGDFTIYVMNPRNELPASYSVSEMAENTAEVMQIIGLEDVCLLGVSMGGMTALEIAAKHPELIEKMVLASTTVQMSEEQFRTLDKWIRLAQEGDAEALYLAFGEALYSQEVFEQSRDLLIEASESVTQEDLNRFVILAESMRGFNVTDELDMIKCPVLAVNSKDDHTLGTKAVESMETYIKQHAGWDFYLYEGYGHALYDTAPDFKDRLSAYFLAE